MLGHILLVSDDVERQFLMETLRAHAPQADVRGFRDMAALGDIDAAVLRDSRLVTFSIDQPLPQATLDALGHGAYNFHPGSPAYPGWMPAAFATYDGASEFGATLHAISAREDAGPIVAVDMFPVAPGTSRAEIARGAYLAMLALFRRVAQALATRRGALPFLSMTWGPRRGTRALFASLCDLPANIDEAELRRRIRGLGGGDGISGDGISAPTIWIHGVPFRHQTPGDNQSS
jgi:hypothetical protein